MSIIPSEFTTNLFIGDRGVAPVERKRTVTRDMPVGNPRYHMEYLDGFMGAVWLSKHFGN